MYIVRSRIGDKVVYYEVETRDDAKSLCEELVRNGSDNAAVMIAIDVCFPPSHDVKCQLATGLEVL